MKWHRHPSGLSGIGQLRLRRADGGRQARGGGARVGVMRLRGLPREEHQPRLCGAGAEEIRRRLLEEGESKKTATGIMSMCPEKEEQ